MSYNLIVKDETPNNFVFEMREESFKDAFATLRFVLPICLFLILVPIGLQFLKNAQSIPSWLQSGANVLTIPCLIADGIIVSIMVFAVQIPAFRKASLPPNQTAHFDRKTGIAKGVKQDSAELKLSKKTSTWEFEISQAKTLTLDWDDPRFFLTALRIRDASGLVLHTFYGFRNDLRPLGSRLGVWLEIPFEDNAPDWKP